MGQIAGLVLLGPPQYLRPPPKCPLGPARPLHPPRVLRPAAAVDGTKLSKGDVVIYNGNTGVYGPKGTRYIVSQVRSGEGKLSNLMLVEFHEEGKPEVLKVLRPHPFHGKMISLLRSLGYPRLRPGNFRP